MNRDQTFIKNKLLDAMIPELSFKEQALPLQRRPNTKTLQRPRSSMITRQSYINLDERLNEPPQVLSNNVDNHISTANSVMTSSNAKIGDPQNVETQRKGNRKYLRVVSNPHEAVTLNSPRQSTKNNNLMRKSAIFQDKKSTVQQLSLKTSSSELKKCQSHHESQIFIQQTNIRPSIQFPINFSRTCGQNLSIKLDNSKINSLEKLITQDEIAKAPLPFSKATYLHLNEASNTLNIRQNKPQPTINYPAADPHSNILRVAIGKVQPVFRTIVRKDISKPGNFQRAQSQSELKNESTRPSHGMLISKGTSVEYGNACFNSQRMNYMMGKQNQMLKIDTSSLRTQIVRQVLR